MNADIDQLTVSLADLLETFVTRAEQAEDKVMPAYTHMQRAAGAGWALAARICRDVPA